MPTSRTAAARASNAARSRCGRPNSLEIIAPATLNRSAVSVFIAAFSCMPTRASF